MMQQYATNCAVLGSSIAPTLIVLASIFMALLYFLGVLAIGISAGLVFPKRVGWTSVAVERYPVKAFLWGILWSVLVLQIAFLLLVSIIGIPLILAEAMVYAVAIVLGYVAISQVVGKKLLSAIRRYNMPMVTEIIWGIVLLTLIGIVPIIGPIVHMIVTFMSIGASWMSRLGEGV